VSKWVPKIRHFDHHYQAPHDLDNVEHINPVGKGATQAEYPACTIVIMEHFKRSMDLPTVLGVVGDLEQKALTNKNYGQAIKDYLAGRAMGFHDAMRLCELIDGNYKMNDAEGVREAVKVLRQGGEDPGQIFSNVAWKDHADAISKEINQWVRQKVEDFHGHSVLWMDTPNHIISTVGRRVVKIQKQVIIVVNTGLMEYDQIYARGANMKDAIEYVRGQGLRGGGKETVMGVLIEKGRLDKILPEILENIAKPNSG
jgi:hypothetical protein